MTRRGPKPKATHCRVCGRRLIPQRRWGAMTLTQRACAVDVGRAETGARGMCRRDYIRARRGDELADIRPKAPTGQSARDTPLPDSELSRLRRLAAGLPAREDISV